MADYMHLNPRAAHAERGRALEPVQPVQVEVVRERTALGFSQKFRLVLGFSPAPQKVTAWAPPAPAEPTPRPNYGAWADRPAAPISRS